MYITSNLIECFPEKVLTCKRNRLTEIINYQTVKIPKRHKIRQVCVPPKSRHVDSDTYWNRIRNFKTFYREFSGKTNILHLHFFFLSGVKLE